MSNRIAALQAEILASIDSGRAKTLPAPYAFPFAPVPVAADIAAFDIAYKSGKRADRILDIRRKLRSGTIAGIVLYRGPSMLTGEPIVLIATAWSGSANSKTGNLVQTYILRSDMHPVDAVKHGADRAICGTCKWMLKDGTRECYVVLGHGPSSVAVGLINGAYLDGTDLSDEEVAELGAGFGIRLGTYGDPAAVPVSRITSLVSRAKLNTGYTHQWRLPAFAGLAAVCMASVDSPEEAREAWALGWRTFRVAPAVGAVKLPGEGECPASSEARERGSEIQCDTCALCGGNGPNAKGRASIWIANHSNSAKAEKKRNTIIRRVPAAA